jgi:hypothetical protein
LVLNTRKCAGPSWDSLGIGHQHWWCVGLTCKSCWFHDGGCCHAHCVA